MAGGPSHSNVFIRGLPASLDQLTLQQLFQSFGAIESCRLQKDPSTGQSKGYGFVKFATIEAAEHAIKSLDGSSLSGSQIQVKFASSDIDASSGGRDQLAGNYLWDMGPHDLSNPRHNEGWRILLNVLNAMLQESQANPMTTCMSEIWCLLGLTRYETRYYEDDAKQCMHASDVP